MDLRKITAGLNNAEGVSAWLMHHVEREETTVIRLPGIYSVQNGKLKSEPNPYPREVITAPSETAQIRIFSEFDSDGKTWRGDAFGQLFSDEDAAVSRLASELVASARNQRNAPFPLPDKDERYPEIALADPDIVSLAPADLLEAVQQFFEDVLGSARKMDGVAVSNLEAFVRRVRHKLLTSAGAELAYPATRVDLEICFLAREGEEKAGEHTARVSGRRLADFSADALVAEYGSAARAIATAGAPPSYKGPVVLLGEAAADFFSSGRSPLSFHASSRTLYEKTSRYEKGKPVHSGTLAGEPLNLVSDPLLPFGLLSAVHNEADGGAMDRVTVAREGNWDVLLGTRRYHHYAGLLDQGIRAPGPAGNFVIPAGKTPTVDLISDCVVVRAFSAFEADDSSGRFSCEIRLGEVRTSGVARPFTSGLLVGNWFEAIADARYSRETETRGGYSGPRAVRFADLTIGG